MIAVAAETIGGSGAEDSRSGTCAAQCEALHAGASDPILMRSTTEMGGAAH